MAVNEKRLSKIQNNEIMRRKHTCDVALVGSLYTEEKHNLYRKFEGMDEFSKGYLDGIIQAQLQVYGYYLKFMFLHQLEDITLIN